MESVGARLKKARLEKKLTLEEVYKKTKIHPNVLLAIEEDRFTQLNPVYLRGFLKIYSRFLGINPQEIIADFKEPKTYVEIHPQEEEKSDTIIAEKPIFKLSHFKPYLKTAGFILLVIFSGILVFKATKFVVIRIKTAVHTLATKPKKEVKKKERLVSEIKPQAKPRATPPTPLKTQTPSGLKSEVVTKPVSSAIALNIRAKEDCYINLKADGKTLFQGVLKKGYVEAWAAKEKIELTVGNAGGIEVYINGNLIPPLGKRKQAIKNIIITKEGLSVPR
ncbi:MAG: DUF4115 domain-containing protein [Candidatus Omnitrophica bacterium]|nr:DUF4115 domain-containing protein [Candidatus Omnitrophota bacterium]MCM8770877.1 DUF4115 domain-containing protein [Candidatus Omnitrophota bacterium]